MFFLSGNFVYSQSVISGTVKDSLQQPIPYINVFLKPENKKGIIAFSTTRENGSYKITTDTIGKFDLNFSSISFKTNTTPIIIEKNKTYTINPVLEENMFSLDEVLLNTYKAITVKKDTISYNADSFKRGNEETVEDLLKNLPGITVEDDGTIKVGNKEIEKVMVEGDDLFEKGYKLLTKNLDASVVNKVEVYDNYSNNRLLKDIEESDKVALNLTLTDAAKNDIFGVLKPGYGVGIENTYDTKANLISFREKSKYYLFGNLNNIGVDATGDVDLLLNNGTDNVFANFENNLEAVSFLKLFRRPQDLPEERINFNNAEMASLNNIYTVNSKIKLKTLGFFNWDERNFFKDSEETYLLNTGNFTNTESYNLRGKQFTGFGKTAITYDISKSKLFEYSGDYERTDLDSQSNTKFNDTSFNEKLNEKNFSTKHNILYTDRFEENKVFQIKGTYIFDSKPQEYSNNRFLFENLFTLQDSIDKVSQESEHTLHYSNIEASIYDRKKNGDLLQIIVGTAYANNNYKSTFQLLDNSNNSSFEPLGFQNDLKYSLFNIYVSANYRYEINNFGITGSLDLRQNFNELKGAEKLSNTPFFINPKVSLDWEINKKNKLTSFFKYESKNPTLNTINNEFVLNRYANFIKGINSLEPLKSSTLFANYTVGNILSVFYANTSFIYVNNLDYFATNETIVPEYSIRELIRLKDKNFFNVQTDANIYAAFITSNVKIKAGYTNQAYQNILNGNLRDVKLNIYNYGIGLRSAFKGFFNFHIGTEWFESKIESTQKIKNKTNKAFLDLVFKPTKKLNFSLNSERYFFDNFNSNNDEYYFVDFIGTYQVLKNKLSFTLEGKNLLNYNTFKNFNIDDTVIATNEYRVLPRFILLKASLWF